MKRERKNYSVGYNIFPTTNGYSFEVYGSESGKEVYTMKDNYLADNYDRKDQWLSYKDARTSLARHLRNFKKELRIGNIRLRINNN